jgi:hypothetical protein
MPNVSFDREAKMFAKHKKMVINNNDSEFSKKYKKM